MALSTFDDLAAWQMTITALHQAAQVVGKIQAALIPKRPNYLHLALNVDSDGIFANVDSLSMEMLGVWLSDRQIDGHTNTGSIVITHTGAEHSYFPISGQTQASLFESVMQALRDKDNLTTPLTLDNAKTDPLTVDIPTVIQYGRVLDTVFTALARFKARLANAMTPLVLFPHHFDISTLIFHESNREMSEDKAHINIGFSPFTEGQYERPYVYLYAYPYPENFTLPDPRDASIIKQTEGWTGYVLPLSAFAAQQNPVAYIEDRVRWCHDLLNDAAF